MLTKDKKEKKGRGSEVKRDEREEEGGRERTVSGDLEGNPLPSLPWLRGA